MKIPYSKSALSFQQQVDQLMSRGLLIEEPKRVLQYFSHINYYRLSTYMYPFLADKEKHKFKEGVTFQNVLDIYNFDHDLRLLIMDAIERIEISFRTSIIYVLSHKYNTFWLSDKTYFFNSEQYKNHIERIKEELKRSDEKSVEHFFSKYSDEIPPSWITLEVVSFSLLSLLFQNLKINKDKKEIAERYGLNHIVFSSWFHSLVYIRNICAHHCRLWNRELAVSPTIPKTIGGLWLTNQLEIKNTRVYYIIAIILYFLKIINPSGHFKIKLHQLFDKYPMIDLAAMGFPKSWKEELLLQKDD